MKTLSTTGALLPDGRTLTRMNEDLSRLLPREIAGAVNLLAHPLAGAAAFSALGIGLASHAFGIWFGAVSSAAEMSERLLRAWGDEMESRTASFGEVRDSAETRAAAAARALIADARSAARAADNDGGTASSSVAVQAVMPPAGSSEEAASEKASQREAARPAAPDDLKAISGIGPKLEKVLNGLGVSRYAEIAAWDRAAIARISAHLSFNGRIERDDWVGQARALAGSKD